MQGPCALLHIKVTPRSSSNLIGEMKDGVLYVKTTASPTDGQANEAVEKLVANRLGVAPSAVSVVKGKTSRFKTLRVDGLDQNEVETRLGRS